MIKDYKVQVKFKDSTQRTLLVKKVDSITHAVEIVDAYLGKLEQSYKSLLVAVATKGMANCITEVL